MTMEAKELFEYLVAGNRVVAGSSIHALFHRLSQRALRLTAEINSKYHEPEDLRRLMSELTARELDKGFGLFPPLYTDCGLNIHIGKRTFINMGCSFQDWGGITIGNKVWMGANVTICPGVEVGDGAIIAAGAVVIKAVPPEMIAAGVPARIIKRLTN